jgi:RNase P subunit RPR2
MDQVLTVAWRLGGRVLLAASCRRCGGLFSGSSFHRHFRNAKDKIAYIDRRCTNCKWSYRVKGKRESE